MASSSCPSATIPRLFLGSLPASLPSSSLLSFLSRFGTPSDFHRSTLSNFAHVSLQADSQAISQCIHTLNNTIWPGGRIRVALAREHYQLRLKREWRENSDASNVNVETEPQPAEGENPGSKWLTGKHVRFQFEDKEGDDIWLRSEDEDEEIQEQSDDLDSASEQEDNQIDKQDSHRQVLQGKGAKNQDVSFTLALFGLEQGGVGTKRILEGIAERQSVDEDVERHVSKRQRISSFGMEMAEESKSVACIDMDKEKKQALEVFEQMFKTGENATDLIKAQFLTANRRMGLYKKIIADGGMDLDAKKTAAEQNKARRNAPKRSQKERTLDETRTQLRGMDDALPTRRSGLYRQLEIS